MRSSERTKCVSEFWELWYVKLFPLCSWAQVSLSSFFLLPPFFLVFLFFFSYQEPPEVQVNAVCKTNHFFFPNRSPAPWLPRVTPLPNMHENVTVCLEAVCRACKFKPQSEDQRQTEKSPQPEKPSWLLWSDDCIGSPRWPVHIGNTFEKRPLCLQLLKTLVVCFLKKKNVHTVTGLLMQSGHIIWGLHLVYVKHVMHLVVGVTPWLVLIMYCRKRQNWSGRTIEKYKHELTGVSLKRGSPYILASSREEEKPYLNQTRRYNYYYFFFYTCLISWWNSIHADFQVPH